MANLCNIDGVISDEADGRVPVLDRGFLFGDSIYEVVRTHGGVPLTWTEHWARLQASAAGLQMQLDLDERTVARRVQETLLRADHGDSYVRLVVTRGAGDAPNIDLAYANRPPCWVVLIRPLSLLTGKPVHLGLVERLRNDRRALDPAAKSGNYLNNVLGLAEAKARGATDCVMLNGDGSVTEASTSNLFVRLDGVWCTPPLDVGILAGITRGMLLEFLPGAGEQVEERRLTRADLERSEEMFLCSTLRDMSPVTHFDGVAMPPAPSTQRLLPLFGAYLRERIEARDAPRWRELTGESAGQV